MKIKLIVVGNTDESYLQKGQEKYLNKLKHYISFEMIVLKDVKVGKKNDVKIQKQEEGKMILSKISASDIVILLDENGDEYNSVKFSSFLQKDSIQEMI